MVLALTSAQTLTQFTLYYKHVARVIKLSGDYNPRQTKTFLVFVIDSVDSIRNVFGQLFTSVQIRKNKTRYIVCLRTNILTRLCIMFISLKVSNV